jgi:hypothetical protein
MNAISDRELMPNELEVVNGGMVVLPEIIIRAQVPQQSPNLIEVLSWSWGSSQSGTG